MNRIQFRNVDTTNVYTLPINPNVWEAFSNTDYKMTNVLDGAPIRQVNKFDKRERILRWPAHSPNDNTFSTMVTELKSYQGIEKEINFGDIDFENRGWKKIKITSVEQNPIPGGELRTGLVVKYIYMESI